MAPEITKTFSPQTDLPLTDEPSDKGMSFFRNLWTRRGELKIFLLIKKNKTKQKILGEACVL